MDNGSYSFNAPLSGSLFGGMADNKIMAVAGESSVGKSYFALGIVKSWLDQNPDGAVVYFDTESAITNQMLSERGIDLDKVLKVEPETIEQFRQSALAILDNYAETKDKGAKLFMVLDSLGNLSSSKEVQDTRDQKETRDMTKAGLIRGTFRVLRLKLSKLGVPLLVTNHVYTVVGCLADTAQVIMADGTVKGITDVVIGDVVSTLEGPRPVTELYEYDVDETIEVALEDGTIVRATPNHKFLTTARGWVRADDLLETDEICVATHEVPS